MAEESVKSAPRLVPSGFGGASAWREYAVLQQDNSDESNYKPVQKYPKFDEGVTIGMLLKRQIAVKIRYICRVISDDIYDILGDIRLSDFEYDLETFYSICFEYMKSVDEKILRLQDALCLVQSELDNKARALSEAESIIGQLTNTIQSAVISGRFSDDVLNVFRSTFEKIGHDYKDSAIISETNINDLFSDFNKKICLNKSCYEERKSDLDNNEHQIKSENYAAEVQSDTCVKPKIENPIQKIMRLYRDEIERGEFVRADLVTRDVKLSKAYASWIRPDRHPEDALWPETDGQQRSRRHELSKMTAEERLAHDRQLEVMAEARRREKQDMERGQQRQRRQDLSKMTAEERLDHKRRLRSNRQTRHAEVRRDSGRRAQAAPSP